MIFKNLKPQLIRYFSLSCMLTSSILFAQNSKLGIDFSNAENKIYLKFKQDQNDFFSLSSLFDSKSHHILRFWNTTNCIEISKNQGKPIGKIYFAIKYTNPENEFLRQEILLSEEQTLKIIEIYQKLNIEKIPTDEKIKNWEHGYDGRTYKIESYINQEYTLKSFWTPSSQVVDEAKTILSFWNQMDEITKLNELWKDFLSNRKYNCYAYYGTAYNVCHIKAK